MLLDELGFLDDPAKPLPASIRGFALWLSQAWQQQPRELDGFGQHDCRPWRKIAGLEPDEFTNMGDQRYYFHLATVCSAERKSIAGETFASDRTLMAHTVAQSPPRLRPGAARLGQQLPSVLKPPLITLRTLTLSGYQWSR